MSISATDLGRMARLARLHLDSAETEHYARQIASILDHFATIAAIDTAGVEPLLHPLDASAINRPDTVTEPDARVLLQSGAPQTRDGYYLVPRVIE